MKAQVDEVVIVQIVDGVADHHLVVHQVAEVHDEAHDDEVEVVDEEVGKV